MRQRLLALLIAALSIAAIVLTALPWAGSGPLDYGLQWSGFGGADYGTLEDPTLPVDDIAARPLGILTTIAAVVALLAAIVMVVPALARRSRATCWVAALLTLVAAAIPVTVILSPQVFLGPPFSAVGAREVLSEPHFQDLVREQILELPTLIALAAVLAATAVVCAVAAILAPGRQVTPEILSET